MQELLAEEAAFAARVQWVPANQALPCFRGVYSAVKQVVRLLLTAASGSLSSTLRVRAFGDGDGVQLVVESEERPPEPINCAFLWGRLANWNNWPGNRCFVSWTAT